MIDRSYAKALLGTVGMMLAILVGGPAIAQSAGPFASLQGAWRGTGQIKLDGGKSEKIECRAYYTGKGGGSAVGVAIECAAADYKIKLRANIVSVDGRLSGSWEEREFNASGNLSGKAAGSTLNMAIDGGGLSGTMKVATEGASQSINITTSGPLKGVNISLSKG